jgi:hypothetical protein
MVNLRKTKKTNHLQVQKSGLKAPQPHAHESVVMTPQCMQGPSVILPLGVLGKVRMKQKVKLRRLGWWSPLFLFSLSPSWG